jgi:hypothetical protein
MNTKYAARNLVISVCLSGIAQLALAQWQWLDKDGRKVFSDRSPPAEIAEKDILKRPAGATRAATATATAPANATVDGKPATTAGAATPKASAPKLSGKDAELEAKKKKAEDDEAAKKKVEEEKNAKVKADNCERGKSGLATLQSGMRVASVNAKGEREVFDDAKRAVEIKRVQDVIDSSCK